MGDIINKNERMEKEIMLNKNTFEILKFYKLNGECNQRTIAKELEISLGTVNGIVQTCRHNEWIDKNGITEKGIEQLEPYKVENAIIMAAGMSSRFAPLSYEKPKGLLKVKGEILIERQIEQLQEVGISDITVVIGYMKEMFFYLEEKYGVKLVINEDYYRYNNTSTLIRVLNKLGNTYICSSDNYFTQNVFEEYVYQAYYSAVYTEEETNEYCITYDKSGRINKVTIGGKGNSWYMLGHVYFSKSFSQKFTTILKEEYETMPTVKEQLWENLYMSHIKEMDLYIKKYDESIIKEFDSLDELRAFDKHYINNTDSAILKNICYVLECEDQDIQEIFAIKEGLTNTSFRFTCKGKKYVYRHPGVGTEEYIHRDSEAFSMQIAKELELDDTFIYMDSKEGWKISHFIENIHTLNYHNEEEVKGAIRMIKKLHDANIKSKYDFNIWKASLDFIDKIALKGRNDFKDFEELFSVMKKVYEYTELDGVEKRLCHCDCYDPNFLVNEGGKIYLIDWEYSGNDDPANDLGTFICCSDYSYEEAMNVLELYFGRSLKKEELRHYVGYIAIASYYWYVWAIYQESVGNTVGEYLYIWYKYAKSYGKKALKMYAD